MNILEAVAPDVTRCLEFVSLIELGDSRQQISEDDLQFHAQIQTLCSPVIGINPFSLAHIAEALDKVPQIERVFHNGVLSAPLSASAIYEMDCILVDIGCCRTDSDMQEFSECCKLLSRLPHLTHLRSFLHLSKVLSIGLSQESAPIVEAALRRFAAVFPRLRYEWLCEIWHGPEWVTIEQVVKIQDGTSRGIYEVYGWRIGEGFTRGP